MFVNFLILLKFENFSYEYISFLRNKREYKIKIIYYAIWIFFS